MLQVLSIVSYSQVAGIGVECGWVVCYICTHNDAALHLNPSPHPAARKPVCRRLSSDVRNFHKHLDLRYEQQQRKNHASLGTRLNGYGKASDTSVFHLEFGRGDDPAHARCARAHREV